MTSEIKLDQSLLKFPLQPVHTGCREWRSPCLLLVRFVISYIHQRDSTVRFANLTSGYILARYVVNKAFLGHSQVVTRVRGCAHLKTLVLFSEMKVVMVPKVLASSKSIIVVTCSIRHFRLLSKLKA